MSLGMAEKAASELQGQLQNFMSASTIFPPKTTVSNVLSTDQLHNKGLAPYAQ